MIYGVLKWSTIHLIFHLIHSNVKKNKWMKSSNNLIDPKLISTFYAFRLMHDTTNIKEIVGENIIGTPNMQDSLGTLLKFTAISF